MIKLQVTMLCLLLCGCGTYMYPKFVEVAESTCKRNDGWLNVYRTHNLGNYELEITCKDGAIFNARVLEKDVQP